MAFAKFQENQFRIEGEIHENYMSNGLTST